MAQAYVDKRHQKSSHPTIEGITKPSLRRLARRGGVKRVSQLMYDESRDVLKGFLEAVLRDAVTYTEYANRKTIGSLDVVHALKRQGHILYGMDGAGERGFMPPRKKE